MVTELLQSVRQSIDERVRNPLLGSFAVFWCCFNWQMIVMILFSETATERIEQLKPMERNWLPLFVLPLLSAIAYVGAMPWITYAVQWYQLGIITRQKEYKLDVEQRLANRRLGLAQTRKRIAQEVFNIDLATQHLQTELDQAKSDLESKEQDHQRQFERLSKKMESFKNTREHNSKDLQEKIADLEDMIARLTEAKNSAVSESQGMRERLKAVQAKNKELEQQIKDFQLAADASRPTEPV